MHTDPIADLLTRIRNAQKANYFKVNIPFSKTKERIANVLCKYHYLENVKLIKNDHDFQELELFFSDKHPLINLTRVSKPGKRVYIKKGNIKKVKNGLGLSIVSTSQGIMAGHEAFKKNLGGEFLCEVF